MLTAFGKLFRTTAFKISLAYLLVTAVGAGLVLYGVGSNLNSAIEAEVRRSVDADVASLAEQYSEDGIARLVQIIEGRVRQPGAGLYLVTTHAGEPLVGNVTSLPAGALERTGTVLTSYRVKGERRRAVARISALDGGFRLLVGHDLAEADSLAPILWRALLNSLAIVTVIGTVGGLVVARRVLARVDRVSAEARRIAESDLRGRLPLAGSGDELDRLVGNINAMLDRIAELMAGMKEVSDNVAHDLKTPLTRLRARAEQALRSDAGIADYREVLERLIEDADTMLRIFDALLLIARAEAGAGRDGMVEFDSADVASDVGELYEPVAEAADVAFEGRIEPGLLVHGRRELIGQALANLVDNALKHGVGRHGENASGDKVVLSAVRRGAVVEIAVADSGIGIAAADRTRVTDRFVRLEASRSRPGTGLGLSLVAAIARLHNGELRVEDNAPGLRVVLALPAVARPAMPPSAPAMEPLPGMPAIG